MINREQQPLSHTVERTGLAVVHEGERIVAAADSAAPRSRSEPPLPRT